MKNRPVVHISFTHLPPAIRIAGGPVAFAIGLKPSHLAKNGAPTP